MKKLKILTLSLFLSLVFNSFVSSMQDKKRKFEINENKIVENNNLSTLEEDNEYFKTAKEIVENTNKNFLLEIEKKIYYYEDNEIFDTCNCKIIDKILDIYENALTNELKKIGHSEINFLDDINEINIILNKITEKIFQQINKKEIKTKLELIKKLKENFKCLEFTEAIKKILLNLFKTRAKLVKEYVEFEKSQNIDIKNFVEQFIAEENNIFKSVILKNQHTLPQIVKKAIIKQIWDHLDEEEQIEILDNFYFDKENPYNVNLFYTNVSSILEDLIYIKNETIKKVLKDFEFLEKNKKVIINLDTLRKKYLTQKNDLLTNYVEKMTSVELQSLIYELYSDKLKKIKTNFEKIENQIETLTALKTIIEKVEILTTSDGIQSDETNILTVSPKGKLQNLLNFFNKNIKMRTQFK